MTAVLEREDLGVGPPREGFADLYAAHFHELTLQLNAYFGNLELAQDVVQEAFIRALSRWDKISRYADPAAWVRRVAWNLATSQWRRARTVLRFASQQRQITMPSPDPDRVALTRALATLPKNQRRAVILHYLADMPIAEIADQEGVPVGTVKSWLSRGRAALSARLTTTEA